MSVKTNELKQISSFENTDSILVDTSENGTGRVTFANTVEYLKDTFVSNNTYNADKSTYESDKSTFVTNNVYDTTGDYVEKIVVVAAEPTLEVQTANPTTLYLVVE